MKKIFIVAMFCSLCLFLSACKDGLCDICGATADIEGEQKELCTKCLMKEASNLVSEGLNGLYEGIVGEFEEEKNCSSCGKSISKDAAFCEHCGASQNDEQPTTSFEPLSFSGTGQKTFRDINIPAGNYVRIGTATLQGDYGGSFNVTLRNSNGNTTAYWYDGVYSGQKSVEKMQPFAGPIKGGYLEIATDDDISWTITIEATN